MMARSDSRGNRHIPSRGHLKKEHKNEVIEEPKTVPAVVKPRKETNVDFFSRMCNTLKNEQIKTGARTAFL